MRALLFAAATLTAGGTSAQPATYTIDPTHTSVVFEADANGLSTLRGRLARQQGSLTLDRTAGAGRAEIEIDTTTLSTGFAAIDAALKGSDALDTAAHPAARFVADRFTFAGDKLSAVEGTLTLRGQDRRVALAATNFRCYLNPLLRREVCGGDFEARMSRADLGLGAVLPALGETFRLLIQVEAIRQP